MIYHTHLPILWSLLFTLSSTSFALPAPLPANMPAGASSSVSSALATASSVSANPTGVKLFSDTGRSRLEAIKNKYGMQSYNLAVVGKGQDGKWIDETWSIGELNAQGTKPDALSLYAIGSNSKLFTALAVGMLVENKTALPGGGTLSFDTKMKDIFGDKWGLMDKDAEGKITLTDVIAMRSGVPRHDASHGKDTPAQVLEKFRYLRPSSALGATWQYSNGHYFLLSEVVRTLSGTPFIDFVQQRILNPLGMDQTYYNATLAEATGHRAEGFFRKNIDRIACAKGFNETGGMVPSCIGEKVGMGWWVYNEDGVNEAGAGGIATCSRDMVKWLKELLEPKVLTADLIAKTYQPIQPMNYTNFGPEVGNRTYGMGQWTYKYRGFDIIEHGGGIPGQYSLHVRVPARNTAFLININDNGPQGTDSLMTSAYTVLDDILRLEPINWEERLMIGPMKAGPAAALRVPLPASPQPAPPASAVLGNYNDMGYGNLTLTSANITDLPNLAKSDPLSTILSSLQQYPPGPVNLSPNSPIYVARLDRIFATYIVFTHFDGPAFVWTSLVVRPIPGDAEGKHALNVQNLGQAAIVPGKGIGMFGNFWGGYTGQALSATTDPAKDAEVWFAKA